MKKIEIILKDDNAYGPQKFLIGSETTLGYKLPRESVERFMTDRFYEKLNHPGVYALIGKKDEKFETIYIGQSDNVAKRLYEHKGGQEGEKQTGKLFWIECLAFVTTDQQMQKGHAEYLEYAFYKKANSAGYYLLDNTNIPREKEISEGDQIFCDDFIEDCDLLSSLMGRPIFMDRKKQKTVKEPVTSERLVITNSTRCVDSSSKFVYAQGHYCINENNEKSFIVLENSIISKEISKSLSLTIRKMRKDLMKQGYVKEDNGKFIFTGEYTFPSAASAASFVLGRSASAKEWK